MSDLWDMTAGAVSFIFGLGVMAGVVITVSGWGIFGTLFGSHAPAQTPSRPCACAVLLGTTDAGTGVEPAEPPRLRGTGLEATNR